MDYLDQYRYANKELNLSRRELGYQKLLCQVAYELYDEQTQANHSLMVLKGMHVEFLSELLKWEKKNQKQSETGKERLSIMAKHLDILSKIQADNYALKWNAGQMRQEIWEQKAEIADLKHRLYLTTLNNNDSSEER